ncbi:MAG: YicC/YloC family endoribonuclease [bacterium]
MIHSMTGYGKAFCEYDNKKIVVEIKSLNSKQPDISTRLASVYREKDIDIRNLISQRLIRGKIEFALYIENGNSQTSSSINRDAVECYKNQIVETATALNLPVPENMLELILHLPDSMKNSATTLEKEEWEVVRALIDNGFKEFEDFRIQEGKSLERVFRDKIANISALLDEVEPFEIERVEKIKSRLEEGLKNLEERISIDRNRLEQEMIFYVEKLDINEEKVRLRNHLNYFIETMENETAQGKKLGFITQEIGREVNTLGSKSNHSEMQKIVVKMKDELEQIKEQILNVL